MPASLSELPAQSATLHAMRKTGYARRLPLRYIEVPRHLDMEGNALIPPGSTPEYELNRVRFLEYLYRVDGRDNPEHPNHCLYTGLFQKHALAVGMYCLDTIVRDWATVGPDLLSDLNSARPGQAEDKECSPST